MGKRRRAFCPFFYDPMVRWQLDQRISRIFPQNYWIMMCVGNPEKVRTASCLVAPIRHVQRVDKHDEVVFSGLLFFGSFLLEEQKK